MKYLFLLLVSTILFSCSSLKKNTLNDRKEGIPKELRSFLSDFETATKNHNQETMLELMDKEYKSEQHDKMLKGRTNQFLNEFFCGQQTNDKGFKCPEFNNIKTIEFIDLKQYNQNSHAINYIIHTNKYHIKCSWIINSAIINKKTVYGLVGAVG